MTTANPTTGAENVVWDLSVFYNGADDPRIDADLTALHTDADALATRYRGTIATLSAADFAEALGIEEALQDRFGRIATFTYLNYATDTVNPMWGALLQRLQEASARFSQTLLFMSLEWKALADDHAARLLDDPALTKYRHDLTIARLSKPYTLSEPEESLLIEKAVTGVSAWERFFTQLVSSLRFEFRGDHLTQSQILAKLYDSDRDVRRDGADAVTATLRDRAMELTYIYNTIVADKASDDRKRGYPTWIESRHLSNQTDAATVDALVSAVTGRYDLVARHYRLKRTLLGVDALYDYDRYAPLKIRDEDSFFTWDEARRIVESAYRAFDERLGAIAARFFDDKWIHAPLLPNKRGGAFASPSVPSAHPFVLVNYTGKPRDVMTLAHELGHGAHMYLSGEAHGMQGLYTPLTIAEMASVFGEMLVFDDLIKREDDPKSRLAMVMEKVEDTFATVFRQTAMNRFEEALHTTRRDRGELSTEAINTLWMETQQAMFGDSVTLRDEYSQWWSYIPHFLSTPGYVYAYAFGELLVLALFNLYRQRGSAFVPQYLDVLAAGGSDYPHNILAKVGVDLRDPNFWHEGLNAIEALVAEEEALARAAFPEKFA